MGALVRPEPWSHVREPGVIRDRTTRRARPWGAPLKLSAGQVHAPVIGEPPRRLPMPTLVIQMAAVCTP